MELSNHRESALKKAALLQMNMKNLRAAAFQRIAQLSQHAGTLILPFLSFMSFIVII
jgi:hypothetical protein